jgi:hypothetical protein
MFAFNVKERDIKVVELKLCKMFKELQFKLDNPKIFSFLLTKSNSNHGSCCTVDGGSFLQYTLPGPTASCCGFCIIYYVRQTLINVRRHFALDFYI